MLFISVDFATRLAATVAIVGFCAASAAPTASAHANEQASPADEFSKLEGELVAAHEAYEMALSETPRENRADGSSAKGKTPHDGRPPILKKMDTLADSSVGGPDGLEMAASTLYWSLVVGSDDSPARFARLATHFPDSSLTAEHLANLELAYTSGGDPAKWISAIDDLGNRTKNAATRQSARFIAGSILLTQKKLAEAKRAFAKLTGDGVDPELARRAKGFIFEIDHLQIGMPAPEFDVHALDGRIVSLKSLRGKPVLIDFWATWCPGCIAEIPTLKRARARFANRFEVLGISLDEDSEALRRAVGALKPPGIQTWDYRDGKFPTALKYNVEGLPTWYLIGPDGRIRARDPYGEALIPAIESALRTESSRGSGSPEPPPKTEQPSATD